MMLLPSTGPLQALLENGQSGGTAWPGSVAPLVTAPRVGEGRALSSFGSYFTSGERQWRGAGRMRENGVLTNIKKMFKKVTSSALLRKWSCLLHLYEFWVKRQNYYLIADLKGKKNNYESIRKASYKRFLVN